MSDDGEGGARGERVGEEEGTAGRAGRETGEGERVEGGIFP